jgi:hypothetical protein
MPEPNNGPTVELKKTLDQLKKDLDAAVEKKANLETVTKLQTQVDALDVKLAQKLVSDPGQGSTLVKTFQGERRCPASLERQEGPRLHYHQGQRHGGVDES